MLPENSLKCEVKSPQMAFSVPSSHSLLSRTEKAVSSCGEPNVPSWLVCCRFRWFRWPYSHFENRMLLLSNMFWSFTDCCPHYNILCPSTVQYRTAQKVTSFSSQIKNINTIVLSRCFIEHASTQSIEFSGVFSQCLRYWPLSLSDNRRVCACRDSAGTSDDHEDKKILGIHIHQPLNREILVQPDDSKKHMWSDRLKKADHNNGSWLLT